MFDLRYEIDGYTYSFHVWDYEDGEDLAEDIKESMGAIANGAEPKLYIVADRERVDVSPLLENGMPRPCVWELRRVRWFRTISF